MNKLSWFILIVASVILTVLVTSHTTTRNQEAGIYPVYADSIGIPLMMSVALALIIVLLMLLAFAVTSFSRFRKRIWAALGFVCYALAAVVAGDEARYWFFPHHYSIAVAYGWVAGVAVVLAVSALRKAWLKKPDTRTAS